jgi:hypothetical protein
MNIFHRIFDTAAKVPGSPEAVTTGVQAGLSGDASWNPYDPQNASVWDIGAGGTQLSQNQNARDVGRTVGTLAGGYFLGPLLAGEGATAGSGFTAGGSAGMGGTGAGLSVGAGGGTLASTGLGGTAGGASWLSGLGGAGSGNMGWMELAANLASTAYQANRANAAAGKMQDATDASVAEQRRQYDQTRADLAPYREIGIPALAQYYEGTNTPTTAADAQADPGYAWAQQQGEQSLARRAAASGGRLSGASLKAGMQFNQGNATQYFGAADARRENRLSRLAALAGIGQSATNTGAVAGANSTNAITGLLSNQGEANAGSTLAQGSIWGSGINQAIAGNGQNGYRFDPYTGRPIGG